MGKMCHQLATRNQANHSKKVRNSLKSRIQMKLRCQSSSSWHHGRTKDYSTVGRRLGVGKQYLENSKLRRISKTATIFRLAAHPWKVQICWTMLSQVIRLKRTWWGKWVWSGHCPRRLTGTCTIGLQNMHSSWRITRKNLMRMWLVVIQNICKQNWTLSSWQWPR